MNSESRQPPDEDKRPASDYSDGILDYAVELADKNDEIVEHLEKILGINCSAHLCIFESKALIHAYVTVGKYRRVLEILCHILCPSQSGNSTDSTSAEGIDKKTIEGSLDSLPITESKRNKLKMDWLEQNKNKIIQQGKGLRDELIPENIKETLKAELQNDNDKIKDIWIFSEGEDIDYHWGWEWIYWKEKNFFWGDKFHIIRIDKGCDMSECPVNKKIFILANDRDPRSNAFVEKLKSKLQEAKVKDSNLKVIRSPREIIGFLDDCIILYAVGTDKTIRKGYENELSRCLFSDERRKIVFFNLYPPGPLRLNILPATWIDSQFDNIKEEITLTFVKCFFKVFLNERKNVRVTEIAAKTREMMERENILWRLACIVNGNPNITLTV